MTRSGATIWSRRRRTAFASLRHAGLPVRAPQKTLLFGLEYYDELDRRQGICHVVGPEQGFTLPGTMIVCGDSHTSTHGALGALAYGIGTTEVEHVLATQTLIQRKSRNMRAAAAIAGRFVDVREWA